MSATAGMKFRASDYAHHVKYARLAGDGTQALNNGSDTQLAFPTAINVDSLVVPSAAGNQAFTIAPGLWFIDLAVRFGSGGLQADLYIAAGSTTFSENNSITEGSSATFTGGASTAYLATVSTAITFGIFQSNAGRTVNAFGLNGTHCGFTKLPF